VKSNNVLYAIIIKNSFKAEGIQFFTPNEYSQQLAYMRHPKGKEILPHIHNPVPRKVLYTQETLFIKKGKLRVDFYDVDKVYFKSFILQKGDVLFLITGGHGFEVLEEVEMIEVKQGPYTGELDKSHLEGVAHEQVKVEK
jgi:hypothetical protein